MNIFIYILIGLAALLVVVVSVFVTYYLKKHADRVCKYFIWRKLYNLAQDYDYYLLNDVNVKTDPSTSVHIDHLLIADKNIYIIASRHYIGNIVQDKNNYAKINIVSNDNLLLETNVSNPIVYNEIRRQKMAERFLGDGVDTSSFKSIVVVDNNIDYKFDLDTFTPFSFICHKKEIRKLILKTEKESNYDPLNVISAQKVVDLIHLESVKNNKNDEKNKKYVK